MTEAGMATRPWRPRIGCAGVGWIGEHRMRAVVDGGVADVVAVADPDPGCRRAAAEVARGASRHATFEELLGRGLDGVMIATPSALHAEQAVAALEHGVAVFCQKPLARSAPEAARVVAAAAAADCLLGVDFSYRHTEAVRRVAELARAGELGSVYALDLVFHNAYGPDKRWFYDVDLAGGGCVMDLGIHLADLALWITDFPSITSVTSQLFAGGTPLAPGSRRVEDYAAVQLQLSTGPVARIACSWNLPAGQDAEIEASIFGTRGAARMRNVDGSFFDFRAEWCRGTSREPLCEPPDAWGGRAAARWARRLAQGARFDPGAWRLVEVNRALDRIYGRTETETACASS